MNDWETDKLYLTANGVEMGVASCMWKWVRTW